jgi:hypothetical protein
MKYRISAIKAHISDAVLAVDEYGNAESSKAHSQIAIAMIKFNQWIDGRLDLANEEELLKALDNFGDIQ